MGDECCGKQEAGRQTCEFPAQGFHREEHTVGVCPACGEKGKRVDTSTVKALISRSLRNVVGDTFHFCKQTDCEVVYFSVPEGTTFLKSDLRVAVYQKAPNDPSVPICYCFRHTVGNITEASLDRRDEIIQDINEGIKLGQCACDIRNPQGSCCLGNVKVRAKELSLAIEMET